jgi:predicted phosphodiesterase
MTIIEIADSHIVEDARLGECIRVHEGVVDIVRHVKPKVVLHAGDLFDAASTPTGRLVAVELVTKLTEEAPLVIARGNHDRWRDLAILAALRTRHPIHVVEDARVLTVGGMHLAVCAWPVRASNADEELSRQYLRDVLRGLGADLAQLSGPRVALGHFMVDGALSGAGQPIIGGGLGVSLEDLALMRADVILMGHIHRSQTFSLGATEAHYAGSPFRTDFGEMEGKNVLFVRFEDGRAICERIPTSARPMLHIEAAFETPGATLPDDAAKHDPAFALKLSWTPDAAGVGQADIRFRYTVALEYRQAAAAAADALKARWLSEGAATVKVEAETITSTRARAPEVAAARTLGAKVEALWASRGDTPEPARASRLLGRLAQLEDAHAS